MQNEKICRSFPPYNKLSNIINKHKHTYQKELTDKLLSSLPQAMSKVQESSWAYKKRDRLWVIFFLFVHAE